MADIEKTIKALNDWIEEPNAINSEIDGSLVSDAVDCLEEQQKYIATLHSLLEKQRQQIEVLEHWKPEWIPTRVNMPKEGQFVLVVTPEYTDGEGNEYTEGVQCAYWLFPQDPTWFSSDGVTYGNGGRIVNPTHWIELPIPPKDGEQE